MDDLLNHRTGQKQDSGEDEEFVLAQTDFLLAVCRPADLRHTFVREVCKWAGESFPDSNNPLNLQLSDGQLVRFEGIGWTNVTFEAVKRSFVLPSLVPLAFATFIAQLWTDNFMDARDSVKAQLRQRSSFKAMLTRMDGMLSFETSGTVTKC